MNLIEFTDERILNGTFKVWNGYLAGLILGIGTTILMNTLF